MEGIFDDKDKNLFPIGGFMPIDIPAVFRGVGKKLRDRMYRTIRPEEYSLEQVENFVKGTPRQYYRNPNAEALLGKYTGQDSIIADYTQAPDYLIGGRYLTEEEKARLGVGSESTLKKYAVDDIIIPSKSKEGAFEFAYPNRLGSVPHLPTNANRVPNDSWPHSHELGTFHQVKTNNDNGSSVTYEDTYDINPFRGKSSEDDSTWRGVIRIGKKVGLDKIGDIVPWGKPFDMHGQQSYDKEGYPKKAEGGFLQPRDTWDALSMKEKAEMIGVAVRNGITNLNDIRDRYNEFAEGGSVDTDWSYNSWKRQIAEHMGIRPDEDNTYDYEAYFNKYPEEAWKMLKGDPTAHFSDEFKTVYHPTFSSKSIGNDGSIYSGVRNLKTNPQGLVGGTWSPDYHTFTMSPDSYRGPVGMDDRKWYLENAEDNGVQLREADGSLPIYDGIPWGGVLPNVTIHGNRHSLGGPFVEAVMNEYKKGGSIHISPSKKGTFTAAAKKHGKSVQAFASQVLAHPENYSPAMRRKANFARNAAKWHGLGGNLFSGEEEGSQQMNIFRRPSGEYFYQASPESEEITVVPRIKVSDNPAYWTYADASGKLYTPKQTATSTQGEVIQTEAPSTWENIIVASNNNYMNPVLGAPARWKASWDNNTNVIRALWDNPAVMGHPLGMAAKTVEHLAGNEGIPKTIRSYQNSDGSDNARWLWQRSLAGDALASLGLFPAAAEGYQLGNRVLQRGRRFILDVGDRYQGMKDAAAYRNANGDMDARTIANIEWWENGGTPTGINRMGISNSGDFGIHYPDDSEVGHWFSPAIEKGGNMTLTTHLGGDFPGDNPGIVLPMSKSEKLSLAKYLKGVPEHTYLGEVGKTKNYAEQYFNTKPSRVKAFKDAIQNKKETNNPYWDEEEYVESFVEEEDPIRKSYYKHLYDANEPLSTDTYKFMLQEAAKDNSRFALRYDSSPMGLFNSQGVYTEDFYKSLLSLPPKEQVSAINEWIKSYYPKARPAYLKDGKVMIPRLLLMKK